MVTYFFDAEKLCVTLPRRAPGRLSPPILTTVLLLLERTCQCSGQLVRHTLHLADNLHPKALAKEIAEYREVGWRVCVLWRGAKSRPKIHNANLCL